MNEERASLAGLDPSTDGERWERLILGIVSQAEPELARRANARSPLIVLAKWMRPTLAAAAVLAFVSLGAIGLTLTAEEEEALPAGVADAIGVPTAIAGLAEADREPTFEEFIIAMEVGQ